MKKVGIVIVNYNGAKYQNDCIRTLYDMDCQDFEIIVVDSASKDNSIDILQEKYPNVHVIRCKSNIGVAAGNNIGIKFSREIGTEYTMLLNNDVEVATNLLTSLLNKTSENIVTVPKIYYYEPKDCLWYAGGKLSWERGSVVHFGTMEKDTPELNEEKYVTYSPTCCMLIHNSIFDKVGYMDETVFMYFDDTDFCVRLNDAGIKIQYVPTAIMWHKVSSASGGENSRVSVYYQFRNQLYYLKKHKEKITLKTRGYVFARAFARWILSPIRKNHRNDKYIFVAYKDYLKGKMGRKDFG